VFTFDNPVSSGNCTVTSGSATAGTPTFSGNEMRVPLTGVADVQIVTLTVSNVNGGSTSTSVDFGFLIGDVNANRTVDKPDANQVKADKNHPVTAANFREDINLSGKVDQKDFTAVQMHQKHHIP